MPFFLSFIDLVVQYFLFRKQTIEVAAPFSGVKSNIDQQRFHRTTAWKEFVNWKMEFLECMTNAISNIYELFFIKINTELLSKCLQIQESISTRIIKISYGGN